MAERWTHTWHDLVKDVVAQELCTGCSGCIVSCPQGVLTLDRVSWLPDLSPDAWANGDGANCRFSERGCTLCARACPRFGPWQNDADLAKWSRSRETDELIGIHSDVLLVQATDRQIAAAGQDGGLGTALLLYALEHGYIDAALVSFTDGEMRTRPGVARTRAELLDCAGSRYTYSPNALALKEATGSGAERLGMISVGCQTSIPAVARGRGASKLAKRFALVVGLLCSKTFSEAIYTDLLESKYGVPRHLITKVNIKGRLQVWYEDAGAGGISYVEVPLKECGEYTRPGCTHCPDFSAEHADLSLGGIGRFPGKTLVIVRSELGREILSNMERDRWIDVADAIEEDPDAVALVRKLATSQRKRWPAISESSGQVAPG